MNVLSALSLFAVLLYVCTGFFVYGLKKGSRLNKLFLSWCLSMAVWSLGYAFVYVTTDTQYIWMKVSALGWCSFGAFTLHLALLLTGNSLIKNPVLRLSIYIPGVVFWYMSVFVFFPGRVLPPVIETFFYTGNFIYNFSYLLLSMIAIFLWGYKSKGSLRTKTQAKIIVLSAAAPFLLNLLTQTILPMWEINLFPPIGHLYTLIMLFGVYYSVKHYRLFNVSPQLLNDMIFAEMMDLAILLSPDGQIRKVSKSTEMLLGYTAKDLSDKSIDFIIKDKSIYTDILNRTCCRSPYRHREIQCLTKTGEMLPVRISCLPLTAGKLDDPEAIVLLGHDIRLTKQLEKQIAEHQVTEEYLRQSEERFKAIFYQNTAIMYMLDCDTLDIFEMNKAAKDYYGYSEEAFKNKKITDINGWSPEDMRELINSLDGEKKNVYAFKHRSASGEWRDVEIHSTPLLMKERKMLISIVTDITDRKRAEEQISYLAYHDALTGLANRKYFYERLHLEMERSLRKGDRVGVLFLDLDGFKRINDEYGHEAGDFLLKEVANRIKAILRATDTVARMGGDEFTLLIIDIADRDAAKAVAQKILDVLDEPVMIGVNPVYIQASIGISIFPDDGGDMNLLLNKADNEMYIVKKAKKETSPYGTGASESEAHRGMES